MGETHYAKERMKELGYKAMALGLMFWVLALQKKHRQDQKSEPD